MHTSQYRPRAEDREIWREDYTPSMNGKRYAALPIGQRCTCTECGWRGNHNDLNTIQDFEERICEGEPAWAGDCPRCEALVNTDGQLATWEAEDKAKAAARTMLAALEGLRKQLRAHVKLDVRRHYSLMVADAAAGTAITQAEAAGIKAD